MADFSLADVFGDSGVVGLALVQLQSASTAHIDTFLMSCRVIGREAEAAFLHTLMRRLTERGATRVTAQYQPTAKNELVKDFLPQHGFIQLEGGLYQRDLRAAPPKSEADFPIQIQVTTAPVV